MHTMTAFPFVYAILLLEELSFVDTPRDVAGLTGNISDFLYDIAKAGGQGTSGN